MQDLIEAIFDGIEPEPEPEQEDEPIPAWAAPTGDRAFDRAHIRHLRETHDPTPPQSPDVSSALDDQIRPDGVLAENDGQPKHPAEDVRLPIPPRGEGGHRPTDRTVDPHGGTTDTGDTTSPQASDEDEDEDEDMAFLRALARFELNGGHHAFCPRGPRVLSAHRDRPTEASVTRVTCENYRCAVCGPRKRAALIHAAWSVAVDAERDHRTLTTADISTGKKMWDTVRRSLTRWGGAYLAFALSPSTVRVYVFDAPRRGAVHRHLVRHHARTVEDAWPDEIAAGLRDIDYDAWAERSKQIRVFRSTKAMQARVIDLRDRLLGRRRVDPDADRVTIVTYETTDELRGRLAKAVELEEVPVAGRSVDPRRASQTTFLSAENRSLFHGVRRMQIDDAENVTLLEVPPEGGFVDLDLGVPSTRRRTG